jgi:hypothetical protein
VLVAAAEDLLADRELSLAQRDGFAAESALVERERVGGLVELVAPARRWASITLRAGSRRASRRRSVRRADAPLVRRVPFGGTGL